MLSEPRRAAPVECPYLPGETFVQDYFFAGDLDEYEVGVLLTSGWRRFGTFFFRPACPNCRKCTPLRVDTEAIAPSRSQRRVLNKGKNILFEAVPPRPTDEAWRVYQAHSRGQFGNEVVRESFEATFFEPAAPALQTEYRLEGELIGLGFLDVAEDGFSSAYFAFDPGFSRYSPGTLSILLESELAHLNKRPWYYLGYWVPGCPTMEYKSRFGPHQLYDWATDTWLAAEEHPLYTDSNNS